MKVTVEHEISLGRIRDVLTNALEGGSNYWISYAEVELPEGAAMQDVRRGGRLQPKCHDGTEDYYHFQVLVPTLEGGRLRIFPDDKSRPVAILDLPAIQRGLDLMTGPLLRHMHDILNENDDADTGDVLLQLAVFGDVVYG